MNRLLLVLICLLWHGAGSSAPFETGGAPSATARATQQSEQVLGAELPARGTLVTGETVRFRVGAGTGQYFKILLQKSGTGIEANLYDARRASLASIPCWHNGPATFSGVASPPASHSLELHSCDEDVTTVSYDLTLGIVGPTKTADRMRAAAEKAMAEADRLITEYRAATLLTALRKYTEALTPLRVLGDHDEQRDTLVKMGNLHRDLGQTEKALSFLQEALQIPEIPGGRQHRGPVLIGLATIFQRRGDIEKAVDYSTQAIAAARSHSDQTGEAHALYQLGDIYYDAGEFEKAIQSFHEAERIWQVLGNRQGQAWAWLSLAALFSDRSDYDAAWKNTQQALRTFRNLGDKKGEAASLTLLGHFRLRTDQNQEALNFYEESRILVMDSGDLFAQATLLAGFGRAYLGLGDHRSSLEFYSQSRDRYRTLNYRIGEAHVLRTIGNLYFAIGDRRKAVAVLEECLNAFRKLSDYRNEAYLLTDLGIVYESLGDSGKALGYLNSALTLNRKASDRRLEAYTLTNLGKLHENAPDPETALRHYREALDIEVAIDDQFERRVTLYRMADYLRRLGRLTEARIPAESAIALIERSRADVASLNFRTSFFASVRQHYDLLIDILMRLHAGDSSFDYHMNAFETSERARARSLLDGIRDTRAFIGETRDSDRQRVEREMSLRALLDSKIARYTQLLGVRSQSKEITELDGDIRTLTAEYEELQGQVRRRNPRYSALVDPEPLNLAGIRNQVLDDNSLLLEYVVGEENSYLWAVSREAFDSFVLPRSSELEKKVRLVRELMTAQMTLPGETAANVQSRVRLAEAQYPQLAAELSQTLLGPVADQLGKRRLVIVAEGVLQYLPFGALPAPQSVQNSSFTPLIVDHEIVNLPSASTLAVIRREAPLRGTPDRAVAVFADPVFEASDPRVRRPAARASARPNPGPAATRNTPASSLSQILRGSDALGVRINLPRLSATRQEADAILAMAPADQGMAALGFNATKAAAMSPDLKRYRIVHFATHTILNDDHPDLSSLVLSLVDEKGNPQSGFLRLRDMYNLPLAAELVVLSACDTALGKEVKGEGLMSMVRGFMYSGTPRVLASLWKVNDEATAELMTEFYKHLLKEGATPAAALRQAQITQMQKKSRQSPYFWAAFQIQGEWE